METSECCTVRKMADVSTCLAGRLTAKKLKQYHYTPRRRLRGEEV
jgi:hypothetical protein